MASFFNRPSYVASWANQRIYPLQEPSFAPPVDSAAVTATLSSPPASPPSPRRTLTSLGSPTETSSTVPSSSTPPSSPRPEAPPPLYFPGAARRASTFGASLPPGHIPSINVASTRQTVIEWAYHPIPLAKNGKDWRKWLRVAEIWPALKSDKEVLWDGWPVEFGGKPRPRDERDEEEGGGGAGSRLSRTFSRRSVATTAADSGVALTPRATLEPQHPLEGLFKKRIAELNELIAVRLELTRVWMALIEVMVYVWFIALIVALATSKGQQSGYLKGVELALVLVILLTGLGINAVRMRRWTLAEELRKRTRDWSPLPITSSTNAGLMRNYLDGDAAAPNVASQAPKDRPVLRWRLRETEGSWWLSYRPIIRCELVTPASASNPLAYLPVFVNDLELEDEVDASAARDRSPSATDEEGRLELPPGYSEA